MFIWLFLGFIYQHYTPELRDDESCMKPLDVF